MIVIRHATDHTSASRPGSALFPFAQALGGCALATFFVASGFLLYRPFLAARVAGAPRPGLGAYALRRVFRIVPAYWAALTVTTVWLAQPLVLGSDWWQFYSFTYVYSGHALAGIGPAWSLCIEVAWYAFLPAFVVLAARLPGGRMRSATAAVVALGVVGLATRVFFAEHSADLGFSPNVVPVTFLDWLALGMGLAIVSVWVERRGERLPDGLRWLDRRPGLAWAVAGAAFVAVALLFNTRGTIFAHTGPWRPHVLYGVFALALVVPAALGDSASGLVRRVLANRTMLYLGVVSYGIFLWHMAVLEQLERWHLERVDFIHPYLLWPLAALLLSTALATLSYRVVERPAIAFRRRVMRSRIPQPAAAPAIPAAREAA